MLLSLWPLGGNHQGTINQSLERKMNAADTAGCEHANSDAVGDMQGRGDGGAAVSPIGHRERQVPQTALSGFPGGAGETLEFRP